MGILVVLILIVRVVGIWLGDLGGGGARSMLVQVGELGPN